MPKGRNSLPMASRRLHGRRGLKFAYSGGKDSDCMSPPSRAAWIEISLPFISSYAAACRRLHGRRGLKYARLINLPFEYEGRRLHGRRGLKFAQLAGVKFEAVAAFTGGVD